jgi:four helix bundle protein
MRRAAQSIPANLSEGAGQGTDPQFLRGVNIAIGSANELGAHLRRAKARAALDPITIQKCEVRRIAICKMLESLARAIEERIATRRNDDLNKRPDKPQSP